MNNQLTEYSATYVGDGITTKFFYPFTSVDTRKIQVFVNSVLQESYEPQGGYSIQGANSITGGFIIFFNPPVVGSRIMVCDNIIFKRLVNFFASSSFTAQDLNKEVDNIYKILDYLNANSLRTVRINSADSVTDLSDLNNGILIKKDNNITTKNLDIDAITTKLDDVSHKYDDLKVRLITAFNRISDDSQGGSDIIKNALVSQNNLNDLIDIAQARKNLGLGEISTLNKIDSNHIDTSILSQNLENLSDPALARKNLGLGDIVTMSKADILSMIETRVTDGLTPPFISTSVYSINKDITPKISLVADGYQPIEFSSHNYTTSDPKLLYVGDKNYEIHIDFPGYYNINGFLSIHGAYNVVAKIDLRKKSDSSLLSSYFSNHVSSVEQTSTTGLCMFNDIFAVPEPVVLTLYIMGDDAKNDNLMLDNPLEIDYLSKFTFLRVSP